MAYMKRNVNLFLLLLVLGVTAALVGLTLYYQTTYEGLSTDYADTVEQVNLLSRNLTLQRMELNNTLSDLQLTAADKTKLDNLYSDLTSENHRLGNELTDVRGALQRTSAELVDASANLATANANIAQQKETIASLEADIDELKEEKKELEEELCTHDTFYC